MSADARHEGAAQASTQPSSPSLTPPAAAAAVAAAPAKAGVAPAEASPGFRWASEPTLEDKGRRFYAAFDAGSLRYSLGDVVYLWPAEHGALPFVAHLESLHEQLPAGTGTDAAGQEAAPPGSKWAGLRWFYRPSEVDVDGPFKAEDHELFWADEYATCPLEAVCGKCAVLTPAQADRRPGSTAAHPRGSDVFVCSRKYLPDECRIVPLDDGVTGVTVAAALQDKPFEVVDGRIVQQPPTAADKAATRPRPKRVRGASGGDKAAAGSLDSPAADEADEAAQPGEEEQPAQDLAAPSTIDPQQPPVKRRRHEQEHRQEL